jgi:hypothetical protein
MQSVATLHASPSAQLLQPLPQSTEVSPPLRTPSSHPAGGTTHTPLEHLLLVQSESALQWSASSHSFAQLPPQSTSVSAPLC